MGNMQVSAKSTSPTTMGASSPALKATGAATPASIPQTLTPSSSRPTDLLQSNPGILFGENHSNVDAKFKLAGMMGDLSQQGVKTLFLEQIEAKDQPILDAYMAQPTAQNRAAVVQALQKYTTHKDAATGRVIEDYPTESYMQLIDEALKNKVSVQGINDMNNADRDTFMAQQIQAKSGGEKFVGLVGYFHTDGATSELEKSERAGNPKFAKGIDSLMKVATMDFERENESAQTKNAATTGLAGLKSTPAKATSTPIADAPTQAPSTASANPQTPQAAAKTGGLSNTVLAQVLQLFVQILNKFGT
jgi:hypothetical protein